MQDIRDKIERNIIGQIEKSRVEVRKLSNVLKAEILLKEAQQICHVIQKIGYSYNFEEKRILDPLGLSVTLKSFNQEDTNSEFYTQLQSIPEIKE